jgi:anti-sigma B factor antagonist
MLHDEYPVTMVSGVPVVTAPEEIDVTNADELRAALFKAAARGSATLVVDMTQTRFCDTAGLHALVGAHKQALAQGGQLRLAASSPSIQHILAITGIDRVIPRFTSLHSALW